MNPVLYGTNEEPGIVGIHPAGDRLMRVYRREAGRTVAAEENFYPFFFVSTPDYLQGFPRASWVKELSGTNHFRYLCAFNGWSELWEAVRFMLVRYNTLTSSRIESFGELPFLHLRPDPVSQFLLQTGKTLFKGMAFNELRRLQLDIETYSSHGARFSNARRPDDRIVIIALSDGEGWQRVLSARGRSEREILEELIAVIRERDPDVIEGHNIYNFDLPYLLARCEFLGLDFAVGRDGSTPRSFDSRMSFAERSIEYSAHDIPGRHIIDTWLLLQSYDVSKRVLESYGLKYAAKHFGFAKEDRVYIAPERISWYWDHDPEILERYALDDVEETRLLSEHLSPSAFYMTQMVPSGYGTIARLGSAAKIESLLLREYVRQRQSVPQPEPGEQTGGGYTDIFYTGVLGPIVDVDVESLYPSIMITERIAPAKEPLGVFTALLEHLTAMRLEAKRAMEAAPAGSAERAALDARQSSFKVLINSFYGYLGYSRGLFNDMKAADLVTRTGQAILRKLMFDLTTRGAAVIEVDTDGIYFVPPQAVKSEAEEEQFVGLVASALPPGINLAVAGRFRKMLSYKKKNYALLGYDNKVRIKGSSLVSRSLEKFGRHFIEQCVERLLTNDVRAVHELYVNLHGDIASHALGVGDFARTELLRESPEAYSADVERGKRNRAASYEVAIASGLDWKPGERISYYITGNEPNPKGFEQCKLAEEWTAGAPDENVPYYLRRLDETARKFEVFFSPPDFRAIFSVEDLFGFSAEGRRVRTAAVEREEVKEEEQEHPEPRIWLEEE